MNHLKKCAPLLAVSLVAGVLQLLWASHLYGQKGEAEFLPDNPLKGRETFVQKGCVVCHSIFGAGGTLGPDLALASQGKGFLELAGLLWNHTPKMMEVFQKKGKKWPQLSPEEMTDIFAYLYSLNYFEPVGNFAVGEKLFSEKRCAHCHSVGGKGGNVGPSLDKYARDASAIALGSALWNHSPAILQKLKETGTDIPVFEGSELADILAYIRGASLEFYGPRHYLPIGSPLRGSALFSTKGCVQCHSIREKGGKVGPDLSEVSFTVNAASIAGILWNHSAAMQEKMKNLQIPWIPLSPEEMADIIAYLYFLEYTDTRGDPVKGKRLFEKQRGCGFCHNGGKESEKTAPDLRQSEAMNSPGAFAAAMWNHSATMNELMRSRGIAWPTFQGSEISDIIAYIRSTKKPFPPR